MTIPVGTLDRRLREALDTAIDRIQAEGNTAAANIAAQMTSLEGIIAQLQAIGAGAQAAISSSETDRAWLHSLIDWLDTRLQTLEAAAGISPPPAPTQT